MKTNRLIITITSVIVSLFAFVACDHREVEEPVVEGLKTSLSFNITAPKPSEVVLTKATDVQETRIEKLALLFYKDANSTPEIIEIEPTFTKELGDNNYLYTATLTDELEENDITSGNWYIYAVANYQTTGFGSASLDDLKNVKLSNLEKYIVSKSNFGRNDITMNESSLLMSGKFGSDEGKVTLLPNEDGDSSVNNFTSNNEDEWIHLRRITAKVSFTFQTGEGKDIEFTPTSYSIYNYPVSSTLFERAGWQTKSGSVDNSKGTFSGDLVTTGQFKNIEGMAFSTQTPNSFTFYMYENAQKVKSALPEDSYKYREKRTEDYNVFTYAPDNATYVVVKGTYNGKDSEGHSISGDVSYTIHLGDFSASTGSNSNFSVRRNSKYNFTVTINGVNSIIVKIPDDDGGQPGSDGNIVRTSAETDVTVDAHFANVMIKIPKGADFKKYAMISRNPYENIVYSSTSTDAEPSHVEWIKFGKPASSTAFASYPGDNASSLGDVYALINDINTNGTNGGSYYIVSGDYYYTTAYVNEYFYEGENLSKFVNADNREMTLSNGGDIQVSQDGHSSYSASALFSIKQKSIVSMYDLSAPNPFGIERDEETSKASWSGSHGTSNTNGQTNTVSIVGSDKSWSTYVSTKNGYFDSELSSSLMTSSGSYANYSCLSRNRDANGDGKIDASEIKWYLPARDQALTMIYGRSVLGKDLPQTPSSTSYTQPHEVLWYWISSGTNAYQANFYEYVTSGEQSSTTNVRCARTLGTYNAEPSSVTEWDASTKTVTIKNLSSDAVRGGGMTGEYISHTNLDDQNIFTSKFQFASNDLDLSEADLTLKAPQITEAHLYSYNANGCKFQIKISNYSDYSKIVIAGVEYDPAETINATSLPNLTWTNNKAEVSVTGKTTVGGTSYTSNASVVTLTRTKSSGSQSSSLVAPTGTASVSDSKPNKAYMVTVNVSNYSSGLWYSTSENGTKSSFNGSSVSFKANTLTFSSNTATVYVWAQVNGIYSNASTFQVTRSENKNNYSYQINNSSLTQGAAKDDQNAFTYSQDVTYTNGAVKNISSSAQSTFSLNELKKESLCTYYSEASDGSDKGQWRIPNQMELLTYFQNGNTSDFKDKNYGCRTQFSITPKSSAGYYFVNVFYIQTNGSDIKVTASSIQVNAAGGEDTNYFRLRCVRDVK